MILKSIIHQVEILVDGGCVLLCNDSIARGETNNVLYSNFLQSIRSVNNFWLNCPGSDKSKETSAYLKN